MNRPLTEAIPHRPEADTFDLRKSWEYVKQAVMGHRLLILFCSLTTVFVVLLYIIIWPPIFQASVMVVGERENDHQRESFYSQWNLFRTNNMRDEIELIGSRAVLQKTVDRLGLTYDDVYHPFLHYAGHLWVESLVGRAYRNLKFAIFKRPCEPNCPTKEEEDYITTIAELKEGIALIPAGETYVGNVVVLGPGPHVAEIANTLVDVFLEERRMRYTREAQQAYDSLHEEVEKARAELFEAEDLKETYYTEQNMLLEYEKDKIEITKWLELKAGIIESESILAFTEQSLAQVELQIEGEEQNVVGARVYSQNQRKVSLENQLVQLKIARNHMITRFLPNSPEVAEVDRQIAGLNEMIQQEELMEETRVNEVLSDTYVTLLQRKGDYLTQIAGVKAGMAVKKAAEAELGERVSQIPTKIKVTHAMGREHSLLEAKYTTLLGKLATAAVSLATVNSAPPSLRIVDSAIPPAKSYWPKKKMFLLLALFLGAFAGAVLGLFLDLIYSRVNRYYLSNDRIGDSFFAILSRDTDYVCRFFQLPPRPKPRLVTKLSR